MKTVFVGGGRGSRAVLELAVQNRLATLSLEILGVVDLDTNAPAMEFARTKGWPTFTRLEDALCLPALELVIELTGIDHVREEIYRQVPENVRVMDHDMARVFWDLDKVTQDLRNELNVSTQLEKEIREDHHQLQEILDSLPDVVMVLDDDGIIKRVNQRFTEVTDKDQKEALGQPCFFKHPGWKGEIRCPDKNCPRKMVLETGKPLTVLRRESCIGKNRQDRESYFEVTANPFRHSNGRMNVVMTFREVTDQILLKRESKVFARHFDEIINTVHGVITIKDLKGRHQVVNPAAVRFFGLPANDFIGKTAWDLFPHGVAEIITRNDEAILKSRKRASNEEILLLHGEEYTLISERILLTGYQGKPVGIFCVSRNMTRDRRLQQELARSEKHAAVGKLAAGVAHEINNPLTGVLTFAEELLEDTPEDDPAHEDLKVIMRETLRCRQIVRDLLDFSRQTKSNQQTTGIGPIIQRAVSLVEKQATFHDIRIDLHIAKHRLQVKVDPNQIQQVILNLIINARDAMQGKGVIEVRSSEKPYTGRVEVEVIDKGCGISEEVRDTIFEPFYSTKGEQGNGLGLPAVRSIIDQHDGEITVESMVGEGSTFRISLPADIPR